MEEETDLQTVRLLGGTFLFEGVDPALIRRAASAPGCERRHFQKGETIFAGEKFERCLGVVLTGRVRVSKDTDDGRGLRISTLRPGDLFGAAALFNDARRFATNLRAEQTCEVLLFPQSQIELLMREEFRIAGNYIRYLSGRILFLNEKIASLSAGSAERRLARYLLRESAGGPDGAPMHLRSMTELASLLNIGRASLYRAMDLLESEGALARSGKDVRILNPEVLCRMTDEERE